jgi:hypothetical protein
VGKKSGSKPGPPKAPPDPRAMFRQAACFEYAGHLLLRETANWFQSFAERAMAALRTGPPALLASGEVFVPPTELPQATVTLPAAMISRIPTLAPTIVIQSFATELYLKSLIVNDGGDPWGHEVLDLFQQLAPARRARMEQFYDEECKADGAFIDMQRSEPNVTFSLTWSLTEMNHAFKTWRYAHESPGPQNSFLGRPWIAARRLALELQPSWAAEVMDLGTPATFPHR